MGKVSRDVGVVDPVNDVVEPRPPNGLTAVAVLVIAPGVFDTPGAVAPSEVVMLVEPGDIGIGELKDPGEDVLLPNVDMLELIDVERGDVGTVGVNSIELPLLPSTDPVWMPPIGLHGSDVLVRPEV